MKMVIDIPDAPIEDYQDLFSKIYGMAASEGLFDDKVKSQRALVLKVVLEVLDGIVNGTPLPKGHGRLIDADALVPDRDGEWNGGTITDDAYSTRVIRNAPTVIEAESEDEE